MQRDSIANTFIVAVTLCVVCAVMVSSAAVGLRSRQEENKRIDKQKNILMAAGLVEKKAKKDEIEKLFKERVETVMVDLTSGEIKMVESEENADQFEAFDSLKEAKSKDDSRRIVLEDDPVVPGSRRQGEVSVERAFFGDGIASAGTN